MKSRKLMLTTYECKLLKLCSDGKTARMIGEELYYSQKTIERQLQKIYKKLKVNNKIAAVIKARELNLI
jgi:LuxR family maltose regulon positive regulatory protein